MRLKVKEKAEYREELLKQQGGVCPLCGTEITKEEATLDHDHDTGKIRRVLHRSCNQVEGRILSWVRRSRSQDPVYFIKALVEYWENDYRTMPIHPSHRTDIEKKIASLRKRMKHLKRERTRQKYRDEINKLKELCSNEQ